MHNTILRCLVPGAWCLVLSAEVPRASTAVAAV
jgi:hypothetical protein